MGHGYRRTAGDPFTGHTGPVYAVATGVLEGRPIVVSAGEDQTVRVWDTATGARVGKPFQQEEGDDVPASVIDLAAAVFRVTFAASSGVTATGELGVVSFRLPRDHNGFHG